jgi:Ca-activated chloride channel family protein
MLQFAQIKFFYLLILLPISILIYLWWHRKKENILKNLADKRILDTIIPDRNPKRTHLKFVLYLCSILCFILALAQPQLGTKEEKIKRKGIDVIIALDLSKSMLAQDITPNRLQKSKLLIQELLKKLDGDRVGLVIFAGNAYTQMPLTVDYSSMLLYLKSLNTNSVPTQGTAIAHAFEQATSLFDEKQRKHKAIIVITDGEDHQEDAIDAAQDLATDGVRIFTIGAGTKKGAKIPITKNNNNVEYKKDAEGNEVITKLNEDMLQALAKAGKGNYYILDNAKLVAKILAKDIAKIETKTINDKVFTNYVEQFQYFLVLGLILLLVNIFIPYKK